MDSSIISDMQSDELLYAAAATKLAARSLTLAINDIGGKGQTSVTITEMKDGTLRFDVYSPNGDLRGFAMDFLNETLLKSLKAVSLDGSMTAQLWADDSLTKAADKDVNFSGEVVNATGGMDAIMTFGTAGASADYYTSASFLLKSAYDQPLTLDILAGAWVATRVTSLTTYNADGTVATTGDSSKDAEQIGMNLYDAKADAIEVKEDTPAEYNVFSNDSAAKDAQVTQWYVNGIPLKGDYYIDERTGIIFRFNANGTITVDATNADQLAAGETLSFNFAYDAAGTDGDSAVIRDSALVSVKVIGENDKAELAAIDKAGVENEALAVNLNDYAHDVDNGDSLTFGVKSATAYIYDRKGTLVGTKDAADLVKIDAATGEMVVDTNAELIDSLNDGESIVLKGDWTATDRSGETASSSFSFNIAGVDDNHVPVAADFTGEVLETGVLTFTVNDIATDADGDILSVATINGVEVSSLGYDYDVNADGQANSFDGRSMQLADGTLVGVLDDGTILYNTNGRHNYLHDGESAQNSVTFTVTDGKATSGEAIATINIIGERTAVVANADLIKTDASLFGAVNLYANDKVNEFSADMGDHGNRQIFNTAAIMSGDIMGMLSLLHDGRSFASAQAMAMLVNPVNQATMLSMSESNGDAATALGFLNMNGVGGNINTAAISGSGAEGAGAGGTLAIHTSDGANLSADSNAAAGSGYGQGAGSIAAEINGLLHDDGTVADGVSVSATGIAEGSVNAALSSGAASIGTNDGSFSATRVSASGTAADGSYLIEAASSLFSNVSGASAATDSVSRIGAKISSDGFALFMEQMQNSMTQTIKGARAMTMQNSSANTFYDAATGQFYAAADLQDGVAAMTGDAASMTMGTASASISDSDGATLINTAVQGMDSVRDDSGSASSSVEASADLYNSGALTAVDASLSEQIAGSVGTASVAGIVETSASAYDSSAYNAAVQEMASVQGLADTSDAVLLEASASFAELGADVAVAEAGTNTQALLGSAESGSVSARQEIAAFTFGDGKSSFLGVAASGALADAKGQFIMFNLQAEGTPYVFPADAALDRSILTLEGLQHTVSIIAQTKLGFIVAADLISGRTEVGGNVAAELGYSGADYQASLLNNLADLGAVGSIVQDDTLFGYITTDAYYGLYSDSGYYETATAMLTIEHTVQNVGPVGINDTFYISAEDGSAVFTVADLLRTDTDRNAAFGDVISFAGLDGRNFTLQDLTDAASAASQDSRAISADAVAIDFTLALSNGGLLTIDNLGNLIFRAATDENGLFANSSFEYYINDLYGGRSAAIVNLVQEGIGSGDAATEAQVSEQLSPSDVWTA